MKTVPAKPGSTRKPLGMLEPNTRDKENVGIGKAGLLPAKDAVIKSGLKSQTEVTETKEFHSTAVQTEQVDQIDASELISNDPPSEAYWRILAEQRMKALQKTLKENQELHLKIEKLEKQKKAYREMLDETNVLVEILQDMIQTKEESCDDVAE